MPSVQPIQTSLEIISNTPDPRQEFWVSVYLEYIKRGMNTTTSRESADIALYAFDSRFPQSKEDQK